MPNQRIKRLIAGGLAAFGVASAILASASTTGPNPVYGFVMNDLGVAFYRGEEGVDCPDGRSHTVREAFLATQPAVERTRLLKPENSVELEKKYKVDYVFGRPSSGIEKGHDICSDADLFDTPERATQKLVQSKIAPGMDLDGAVDGRATAGTCAHDDFTSPTGEKGVDNQFFRAVACNTFWRGAATGVGDVLGAQGWADNPVVVVVYDVQSWQDDPHVEVVIAPAKDKPQSDVKQQIVAGASLTLSDDPRYRLRLNGKIVNGLLTTESGHLIVPYNWSAVSGGEFIVRHIRLRVRRTEDGELTGEAGGYRPIDNAIGILHVGGVGVASVAGVECASVRKTLRILADGDPDPKTKQCTSVSSGMTFNAKPAFIFDKGSLVNPARD
jgi:hypothetical protein